MGKKKKACALHTTGNHTYKCPSLQRRENCHLSCIIRSSHTLGAHFYANSLCATAPFIFPLEATVVQWARAPQAPCQGAERSRCRPLEHGCCPLHSPQQSCGRTWSICPTRGEQGHQGEGLPRPRALAGSFAFSCPQPSFCRRCPLLPPASPCLSQRKRGLIDALGVKS